MTNPEVRITHLRPREFRARRDACALAWLPTGTIEWHGQHLPMGFDGVKAEGLCIEGARRIGGVVFPPLFYGDHRGLIMETLFSPDMFLAEGTGYDHRERMNKCLGTSVDVQSAGAVRDDRAGAKAAYEDMLLRMFWMIRAYGFTRIVAVAGHYPNATPLGKSAARFHDAQRSCRVITGSEGALNVEASGGDHAGPYETAQLMELRPELVELSWLDDDPAGETTGTTGDPRTATPERGREIIDGFVAYVQETIGDIPAPEPRTGPDEDGIPPDWPGPISTAEGFRDFMS